MGMMDDEPVLAAMERYGGSFIQALAVAWRRADDSNRLVLKTAFPAYWAQYADVAEQDSRRELRRRNGVPEPPTSIPWPQFSADGTSTECNPNRARALAMVRNALVGLVGASTREELEQMELAIRSAPAAAEDKVAALDGIHALLATLD
jgi:hypothetical protein